MFTLRFAVPAILATAAATGCFSYFVIVTLPARFEADARLFRCAVATGRALFAKSYRAGIDTN